MGSEQSGPGDFISLSSSEDDIPMPVLVPKKNKKKRSHDDATRNLASSNTSNGPAKRAKRARVSSSAGSISDAAKGSEEGEIDENREEGDQGQTPAAGSAEKVPDGATSGVFVPPKPQVFVNDSLSFQLPVFSQKREGSWVVRFTDWVQVFCTSNSQHAASITPALVQTAYKHYIDNHSGLKSGKKRGAKHASVELEETGALASLINSLQPSAASQQTIAITMAPPANPRGQSKESAQSNQSSQVPIPTGDETPDSSANQPDQPKPKTGKVKFTDLLPKSQQNGSTSKPPANQPSQSEAANGTETQEDKGGIPTGAHALELQRRYFPWAADPSNMCLLCGREGHIATNCDRTCKFCDKPGHWDYTCSTLPTRCGKCKQLGHASTACVEKLALTKDEGLACLFCKATDHLEPECTEPWRTYRPAPEDIKKVVHLPISCSLCASREHFSSDCPDRPPDLPPNPTWSLANRNRHVDPTCGRYAIEKEFHRPRLERAEADRQPDFRIRGHASRATHVHYSESDDSEIEFLGQRAANNNNNPARIGQIRFSSNIQMPNGRQQPPLPRGLPPALPLQPRGRQPSSSSGPDTGGVRGSSQQQFAPPTSLPAKPPAPTRDQRNAPPGPPPAPPPTATHDPSRNQPGRGGRGGYGPRGGGRGGRGGGRGGGGRGNYRGGRFRGQK